MLMFMTVAPVLKPFYATHAASKIYNFHKFALNTFGRLVAHCPRLDSGFSYISYSAMTGLIFAWFIDYRFLPLN